MAFLEERPWNDSKECGQCMDAHRNTRFIPCQHSFCCEGCADSLLASGMNCPKCRKEIKLVEVGDWNVTEEEFGEIRKVMPIPIPIRVKKEEEVENEEKTTKNKTEEGGGGNQGSFKLYKQMSERMLSAENALAIATSTIRELRGRLARAEAAVQKREGGALEVERPEKQARVVLGEGGAAVTYESGGTLTISPRDVSDLRAMQLTLFPLRTLEHLAMAEPKVVKKMYEDLPAYIKEREERRRVNWEGMLDKILLTDADFQALPMQGKMLARSNPYYRKFFEDLARGKYALNDFDLKYAVELWGKKKVAAETLFGHISKWDVSQCTINTLIWTSFASAKK